MKLNGLSVAITGGASGLGLATARRVIDAGGLVPDLAHVNSWTQVVDQVDPLEMLEVQLANTTAPFLLISKLRASLAASPARRTYIVNVSAMEGVFNRGYKGPGHPHTNMAKAALNMLTRTSASEMLETDGILSWNMAQSFFQRRLELCTLTATVAGGAEGYELPNVPVEDAVRLMRSASPELLGQFSRAA